MFGGLSIITNPIILLFMLILMGFAVIKVLFTNFKHVGILLIQIAVSSLYIQLPPWAYGWIFTVAQADYRLVPHHIFAGNHSYDVADGIESQCLLFNVLSFMSDKLLTEGNTATSINELYLFLTNLTAIEYIRNFMKRVCKKESAVILASQNLEDFTIPSIAELTKPPFSIPTHAFFFNAGNIDKRFYMETLQLEELEYKLIRFPPAGRVPLQVRQRAL